MTVLPLPELDERRTTADHIADALREAILTGASRGIGHACALRLARTRRARRVALILSPPGGKV